MDAPLWIIAVAVAFVVGSVPFGLIIGRLRGVDVRSLGSKNIGATNVGRVLGRPYGFLCFFLDALKGAAPVLGALTVAVTDGGVSPEQARQWLAPLVGAGAILGHVYSPWVGFKGGKGVATSFGALVAMWPAMSLAAISALGVWLAILAATRFVSLASMCAASALPLFYAVFTAWPLDLGATTRLWSGAPLLIASLLLCGLVIFKHRANIARLRSGTEPRVGQAKTPRSATVPS